MGFYEPWVTWNRFVLWALASTLHNYLHAIEHTRHSVIYIRQ
jgi:hypothetical protein